jgi:alpha-mannosidase
MNLPPRVATGSPVEPLVRVDGNVFVEAVKLAEDGSGDVVVRLYEPQGSRTTARVTPNFETTGAREVDLLERPIDHGAWDGHRLAVRPFQIVTLRFAR